MVGSRGSVPSFLKLLLISSVLVVLFSLQVSGVPLGGSDNGLQDQTLLKDDDPLKDFVTSVANEKEDPTLASSPPKPRFSIRINSQDDVYIDPGHHNEAVQQDQQEMTITTRPSWFTSTLMARRLLALSKFGVASTIYPPPSPNTRVPPALAGQSISLPEYIADCEEALLDADDGGPQGNPILLGLYVSTTFQNAAAGSNISLSIDWWDHLNKTSPLYPGFPLSAAGLPRVSLLGYVERFPTPIANETRQALESCFLASHPDAEAWLPGNPDSPHAGFWAKMVVTKAYWIGGFGDLQQIGWINMTEWNGIRKDRSLPGVGDGRGWDDVRLPGEDA
ncbi:hypothetical protein VTN96DRAFT_2811 [Rasamsonia emersonii]|uniref:CREG-like beta-barrel domain-containing protein n=1 Tax=Rasamsonia emersonii (strain ATCC 16479 / CBS 393.64 / IMI 116815) TaxID=1408163 RepID=A0A0F4Z1X9_RASE3|nr:hypothetical protein T310_1423 [Rasamsonia emersonii CBS 393.64]KKA24522.1 hypothetical protein T310_1423 [Rasamsonia emersonii CBS 393.64]